MKKELIEKLHKGNMAVFEDQKIRRIYDEETERWFFSVIDIICILIQQPDYQAARNYWKVLKNRLKKEGNETVTHCNRLKLTAEDGKSRLTDVADAETLLRLVQSIAVGKGKTAYKNYDQSVRDHFVDVNKMIGLAKGAERAVGDIALT